jgi:uncharacterized protein (DUF362 family)
MKKVHDNDRSESSLVSIVKSSYSTVYEKLVEAVSLAGSFNLEKEDKIIVKINLCDARTPDTGAITHPLFLDATLRYLRERFKDLDIFVVESDGRVVLADFYAKWFGFMRVIERWNAKWCNLSKEQCLIKELPGLRYGKIPAPALFENSFFITLPKLKTNALTKITCCLKNQRGCNPMMNKQQFHPYLDDAIVAENLAVGGPDFCIVDGIVGVGGIWGPAFGVPIHSRLIIAGKDPVAVDCVCSEIMRFNPRRIGHIRLATKHGLGSTKYRVVGERVTEVKQDFQWNSFEAMLFQLAERVKNREFRKMRQET